MSSDDDLQSPSQNDNKCAISSTKPTKPTKPTASDPSQVKSSTSTPISMATAATITMNAWETSALDYNFTDASDHGMTRRNMTSHRRSSTHDPLIYPGLYAPSGIDVMSVLFRIISRPNPTVDLGPIDCSVSMVVCDLTQDDRPIVYCSDPFLEMTGYKSSDMLGKNCRMLQTPGGMLGRPRRTSTRLSTRNRKATATTRPLASGMGDDAETVSDMRRAIKDNTEFQTEIINYKKDGKSFVNLLSIIPITWDSTQFKYSVGFMCEVEEE